MSAAFSPLGPLFDGAPDLYADYSPEYDQRAPISAPVIEMPAPAPKQTLRDHLSGVELILAALDELDAADQLTEEQKFALSEDLISALAGTRQKVDNVSRVLAMFEGLEASAAAEIERLKTRAARFARQRERLTDYVLATMQASNLRELAGDTVTLKLRQNPPRVAIDDEQAIPARLKRFKPAPPPEPNKTMIAAELKAGREVPGARLIESARLDRK
jgi:hypothetical protein